MTATPTPTILVVEDENKHGERERAEQYLPDCVRYPLPSADYAWDGKGPGGKAILCGWERKRTTDLARCVAQTQHHLVQLRRMVNDYDVLYLGWEGPGREGADGLLETMAWNPATKRPEWVATTPKVPYSRVDKHLETIAVTLGVRVMRSSDYRETCTMIRDRAEWWQSPPEHHTSALAFPPSFNPSNGIGPVGLVPRIAKELNGIGWEVAGEVGARFQHPHDISESTVDDWLALPGAHNERGEVIRRLGMKQVVPVLRQWFGEERAAVMVAKWEMANKQGGRRKK